MRLLISSNKVAPLQWNWNKSAAWLSLASSMLSSSITDTARAHRLVTSTTLQSILLRLPSACKLCWAEITSLLHLGGTAAAAIRNTNCSNVCDPGRVLVCAFTASRAACAADTCLQGVLQTVSRKRLPERESGRCREEEGVRQGFRNYKWLREQEKDEVLSGEMGSPIQTAAGHAWCRESKEASISQKAEIGVQERRTQKDSVRREISLQHGGGRATSLWLLSGNAILFFSPLLLTISQGRRKYTGNMGGGQLAKSRVKWLSSSLKGNEMEENKPPRKGRASSFLYCR